MTECQRELIEIAALRFSKEGCDFGGVKGRDLRYFGILPTISESC